MMLPPHTDPDTVLMLAIKGGDTEAFSVLFEKHNAPLQRFIKRFINQPAIVEELAQDIFIKLFRAAPSYEPKARFSSFLYRVAANHCLNETRKADYRYFFSSLDVAPPHIAQHPALLSYNTPPEQRIDGQRLAQTLRKILKTLPENQRKAFVLHRFEARSYREIAEELNVSVGAVKSLIHRAKTTLTEQLQDGADTHLQ
jgi:RNA polymerase sigma-70 factor (ECF subfamily)